MNAPSLETARAAAEKAERIARESDLTYYCLHFSGKEIPVEPDPSKSGMDSDEILIGAIPVSVPSVRFNHPCMKKVLESMQLPYFQIVVNEDGLLDKAIQQDIEKMVAEMIEAIREYNENRSFLKKQPPDHYNQVDRAAYIVWQHEAMAHFREGGALRNNMVEMLEAIITLADEAGVNANVLKQVRNKITAKHTGRGEH